MTTDLVGDRSDGSTGGRSRKYPGPQGSRSLKVYFEGLRRDVEVTTKMDTIYLRMIYFKVKNFFTKKTNLTTYVTGYIMYSLFFKRTIYLQVL